MNEVRRRALRNGAVAATVTAAVGILAVVSAGGAGPIVMSPSAGAAPPPSSSAQPPISCRPAVSIVPTEDAGEGGTTLLAVSAVAPDDGWAVGGSGDPIDPPHALYERWDGAAWTAVEGPNPGSIVNQLLGVDEISAADAWAVGRTDDGGGDGPLLVHYDGAAWTALDAPADLTGRLLGVSASGSADVWAVGSTGDPALGTERAIALHFDGTAWTQVDILSAIGGGPSRLVAVSSLAPDDVWAIGTHHTAPSILHFDGSAWRSFGIVTRGVLEGLAAVAPDDIWAVGSSIQHFAGDTWVERGTVRRDGILLGIAALTAQDVWAVGARQPVEGASKALVMRWNGGAWSIVPGGHAAGQVRLTAVTAVPEGTILAVGSRDTEAGRRTFAVRADACPTTG
jgi:hypothetical protein